MEQFIVGFSEDVEAEYGMRVDSAVTLLTLVDDEITSIEGFATIAAAKADLKANEVPSSQIQLLG